MSTFKKTVLFVAVITLTVLIIAFYVVKVIDINHKYPEPINLEYKAGVQFNYNEFSITLMQSTVYSYDSLVSAYPELVGVNFGSSTDDLDFLLTRFAVKNCSDSSASVVLYSATFSNLTYSNGIDMIMFDTINDKKVSLASCLAAGEEVEIVFTFSIVKSQAGDISTGSILLNLYPERVSFALKPDFV